MNEPRTSILKIIDSVRKRQCIWDLNSGDYSKRNKVERAWREVSEEIGCSESYCKDKWKNVRTGFLRSIKDVPPNKMTLCKRKPFYLYDEMKFLLPYHLKKNEQNCTLTEAKSDNNEISEDLMLSDEEKEISLSIDDTMSLDDRNNPLVEMSPSFNQSKSDINMASTFSSSEVPKVHKRSKYDIDTILLKHLTKRRKKSPVKSGWQSFLKGLMPDILSLSPQKQRFLKKKFAEIVHDMHETE